MDQDLKIAVLIDADNISEKYIQIIMDETANIGIATYKRIYGERSCKITASFLCIYTIPKFR